MGPHLEKSLECLGVLLDLLEVLLNCEVHRELLLTHFLQIVVYNADLVVKVRNELLCHLLFLLYRENLVVDVGDLLNLPELV